MKRLKQDKTLYGISCFALVFYVLVATAGVFVAGIWAYAGIGGAIILSAALWAHDKGMPWPEKNLALFALSALAIMAVETLHSTSPVVSWREWLKLVTIFVPLLLLSSPRFDARLLHRNFIALMLIAVFAGAMALSVELTLGGPLLQAVKGPGAVLTHYNRGLSFLMILAFPLMAGFLYADFPLPQKKRWALVLLFVFVLMVPAGLTESRAAKLALLLALLTTAMAGLFPIFTRRALAVLAVICVSWPFVVQKFFLTHYELLSRFPDSWRARIEIWDYMSYRIMERPLLGWGLGTAHLLPFQQPHGDQYTIMSIPAAHPHNVMTELWVELGLPGLALGICFAILILHKAGKLNARLVPFALGAWMAAFTLSLVAYDFWTDSLFSAFALAGLLFQMLNKKSAAGRA